MSKELPRNVAVISQGDLERIRRTCQGSTHGQQEAARKQQHREALHEVSKEKTKQWGTTIEDTRQRKELDRYQRFEDEELERRKLDAEEEEFQYEIRRGAIERANQMFHDSSDQVKAFHSKMFLADILQEREMQLEIQQRKQEIQQDIEEQ